MSTNRSKRGRPRTITRERIAAAGIQMGLRHITFVGVANELGVSHMALYKHVANLAELKKMVAEEIFNRWQLPDVKQEQYDQLIHYLTAFKEATQALAKTYPGLAPYLIRRAVATPEMMTKIKEHQHLVAEVFHIPQATARWMLSTLAFHCIAVADTMYSTISDETDSSLVMVTDLAEMEAEFDLGMNALITGMLSQVGMR